MIDLIGHSVSIKDIGLLQFMYPNFKVLDKPVLFSSDPIIYTGETQYINEIKALNVPYIIIAAMR